MFTVKFDPLTHRVKPKRMHMRTLRTQAVGSSSSLDRLFLCPFADFLLTFCGESPNLSFRVS